MRFGVVVFLALLGLLHILEAAAFLRRQQRREIRGPQSAKKSAAIAATGRAPAKRHCRIGAFFAKNATHGAQHVVQDAQQLRRNRTRAAAAASQRRATRTEAHHHRRANATTGASGKIHRRVLSGPHTIQSMDGFLAGDDYLYVKTLGGVSTWPSADGDESKWTVSVDGSKRVVLANVKWPEELLTLVEDCDEDQAFNCDYISSSCSEDDMFGCWDEWEIYEPSNPEGDQEGGVFMKNKGATYFLENDCESTSTPRNSGLWFFEPPLDAGAIFGQEEIKSGLGAIFR